MKLYLRQFISLKSQLFQVSTLDPLAFMSAVVIISAIMVLAAQLRLIQRRISAVTRNVIVRLGVTGRLFGGLLPVISHG